MGNRINKIVWDDYSLNPAELLEDVWTQIPDWKEGIEVSDGLFRQFITNYPESVVRELFINSLVHRPYTTRGDIFINLFPDRLEISNPGLLPIGVTPKNILHKSVRRNEKLSQIFYDLKLMEREGSGYDKVYETLLTNGKQIPETIVGNDSVKVIVKKQIMKPEIISFINRINLQYQLLQKEAITLGLIAQYNIISALDLSRLLELQDDDTLRMWLGRLKELNIINAINKTKATKYTINPKILKQTHFKGKTNLKRIENHRLKELIYQDLLIYEPGSISEIHERIGKEIPKSLLFRCLKEMVDDQSLCISGKNKWTRYSIKQKTER